MVSTAGGIRNILSVTLGKQSVYIQYISGNTNLAQLLGSGRRKYAHIYIHTHRERAVISRAQRT